MSKKLLNNYLLLTYLLIFFVLFFGIIYLFFGSKYNLELDSAKENSTIDYTLFNSGNYDLIISDSENKGISNLNQIEKIGLINAYLNYGNYFYKEDEYSKKALNLLNKMDDDYEVLYYKGYANEIVKNYTGAISFYDKALKLDNLAVEEEANLLNQKGHLYDLMGKTEDAYNLYMEAYGKDNRNYASSVNLARYYSSVGLYDDAEKFFLYSLNTPNIVLKSEIYFSLSSIELEKKLGSINIDKSINYAKLSIDSYSDYPLGYLALARGLYLKNNKEFDDEIIKNLDTSIKLNPNGYESYYYYSLYFFDKGDFDKSIEMLKKALVVSDKDMILMDNQKSRVKNKISNTVAFLTVMNLSRSDTTVDIDILVNNLKNYYYWNEFFKLQLIRNGYGFFNGIIGIENYVSKNKDLF